MELERGDRGLLQEPPAGAVEVVLDVYPYPLAAAYRAGGPPTIERPIVLSSPAGIVGVHGDVAVMHWTRRSGHKRVNRDWIGDVGTQNLNESRQSPVGDANPLLDSGTPPSPFGASRLGRCRTRQPPSSAPGPLGTTPRMSRHDLPVNDVHW